MTGNVRFSLSITFFEMASRPHPIADIGVQVWNGDEHVTTIKLFQCEQMALPESAPLDTVENFAAVAARAVGRALDEIQYSRIERHALHHRRDWETIDVP